ncbi:MAG: amino acid ABC transporter substrate-binding protein [Lentisphaeria bacterium]|nr:amino acid ABC transporter substrate-binding protein [Lentisphaeria bacterium]
MWKKMLSIAVCAFLVCVFTGCSEDKGGKKFTVGFDSSFPPYGYVEKGEFKGFDLDLAREVAKRNSWEIVLRPINWDAKDMELNSGSIDCIWNGFTINGRENSYEWSEPYVDNSQVVLVKKSSGIKNLAGLKGKVVAVQTDTPVQKALSAKGSKEALGKTFKKLIVTPNYNNAVMELEAGSVDAVAMDIGVAQMKAKENKAFVILPETVITEKYGIGFKKGNTALRDAVQNTLKEMVADGTAAKISAKYFDGRNVLIIKGAVKKAPAVAVKAVAPVTNAMKKAQQAAEKAAGK